MLAKAMQLRCVGHGPTITYADIVKSLVVTLGGTAVLTFAWVWANRQFRGNPSIDPYVHGLAFMAYLVPIVAGLRYTSLKGRSERVQAIFMLGMTAILLTISLVATWLSIRF